MNRMTSAPHMENQPTYRVWTWFSLYSNHPTLTLIGESIRHTISIGLDGKVRIIEAPQVNIHAENHKYQNIPVLLHGL